MENHIHKYETILKCIDERYEIGTIKTYIDDPKVKKYQIEKDDNVLGFITVEIFNGNLNIHDFYINNDHIGMMTCRVLKIIMNLNKRDTVMWIFEKNYGMIKLIKNFCDRNTLKYSASNRKWISIPCERIQISYELQK